MKKARIIDGIAVDVCDKPEDVFHPTLCQQFIEVPDDIQTGYMLVDGEWIKPTTPEEIVIQEPQVSTIKVSTFDFKLLLTSAERVAVNESKATDALVNDFFSLIDDPRMTTIDLTLRSTKDIINHLVTINILTPQRAEDILANKPV